MTSPALAALLFTAATLHAAQAQPEPVTCGELPVQVRGASAADAKTICQGVDDAVGFFRSRNHKLLTRLEISVSDKLVPEVRAGAVGCFLEDEARIVMLAYEQFRKEKTWFSVPVTRTLYRSLAAHEVAHALAACNFSVPSPTLLAKEYVAYVTTFATMDPGLRAQIMGRYPGRGFESADRFTQLLCLVDPMRFGVESYRHYLRPENGDEFVREVLASGVLQGEPSHPPP